MRTGATVQSGLRAGTEHRWGLGEGVQGAEADSLHCERAGDTARPACSLLPWEQSPVSPSFQDTEKGGDGAGPIFAQRQCFSGLWTRRAARVSLDRNCCKGTPQLLAWAPRGTLQWHSTVRMGSSLQAVPAADTCRCFWKQPIPNGSLFQVSVCGC